MTANLYTEVPLVSFVAGSTAIIDTPILDQNGAALNLDGATLAYHIFRPSDHVFLLTHTLGAGIVLVGAASAGVCRNTIASTETGLTTIPPGHYKHELWVTKSSVAWPVFRGPLDLE